MKIGLDFHGVLSDHPIIREWVNQNKSKEQFVIISAIKEAQNMKARVNAIKKLDLGIPYHILRYEGSDYNAGLKKAALMKKLGVDILIDDERGVIKAVEDKGLEGMEV